MIMARKGQFKKGGGRHGSSTALARRPRARARTITKTRTKYVTRKARPMRRRHRRHAGSGGNPGVAKIAISALALGALAGDNSTIAPASVKDFLSKIPGQKTFGGPAIAGMALGGAAHFLGFGGRFKPWMKAAGIVGLVLAGLKVGSENTGFKFVGDVEGDDDMMETDID
jgi:hypothetical protein